MIESVLATIGKLFEELTWRRFLSIIVFGTIAVIAVLLYERYTSNFRLGRVQRASEVLKTLREIEGDSLKEGSETAALHGMLLRELQSSLEAEPLSLRMPSFASATLPRAGLYKFVAGGFWWFLFAFFAARSKFRGDPNAGAAAIGFLFIGLVFGSIGWLIPTLAWPWVNLVIYPVGHIVLLAVLLAYAGTKITANAT